MLTVESFLLPLHAHCGPAPARCLRVLSSHPESPLVPQTPVALDLVHPLDVLPQLGLQHVGGHLHVLALLVVPDPVQEPPGHSVPLGVVDDTGDGVALFLGELAGPDSGVDPEHFADQEPVPAAHASDFLECEGHCALAINVGIQDTMDVLECVVGVFDDERHCLASY